jgi:hypothetical protein
MAEDKRGLYSKKYSTISVEQHPSFNIDFDCCWEVLLEKKKMVVREKKMVAREKKMVARDKMIKEKDK